MRQDVDVDFARYVRARQHQLLRAAYLVCGDTRLAQDVLERALSTVAGRWERLRDHPDPVVRQHLYRDAVSAAKRARRDSLSAVLAAEKVSDGRDRDPVPGWEALGPELRAPVVLVHFEERGAAETAEVLGEPVDRTARHLDTAMSLLGAGSGRELGVLLDRSSQHLVEVDLAERAWATALAERAVRRRRILSGLGGIAAVGVVVAVAQGIGRDTTPPVPPTPSPTSTVLNRLPDGTVYASMPREGKEDQLPDYDAGLPSLIDPRGRVVSLSKLPSPPSTIVAVYLRRAGTHYRAVLVPKDRTQVLVDELDLLPVSDGAGNEGLPLGPKAISTDGRSVVFAQPGAVVRLDLDSGKVGRYVVPAPDLEVAGWGEGSDVVVRTPSRSFTLDLADPAPRAVPGPVPAPATEGLGLPVTELVGETMTAGRWSASGAYLDQVVTSPVIVRGEGPIYQGLVAVDSEARTGRVLIAPESPDGLTGRFVSCCTALGWADPSTLLFRSAGYDGSWVLAWNVETGRVYDVTRLDEGGGVDYPRALALAVGSRG